MTPEKASKTTFLVPPCNILVLDAGVYIEQLYTLPNIKPEFPSNFKQKSLMKQLDVDVSPPASITNLY